MIRFLDRKVIGAVLAGALVLSTVPVLPINNISVIHADDTDEIAEAEEKISSARVKKQAAEEKLAQLEANKEDLLDVIEKLDNEITGYEQKIAALTEERNALQAKASIAESDLQNAYVAEAIQYESMKERIQFAYENGDTTYLNALISVKDYSNVNNQAEYVSQVSTYDQTQLNALLEIEQTIASYEVEINDNLTAIEDLKTEAEGEQEALQVMQDGKQETLAEYNQEISETEYSIEQLEALEVEQDNVIAAIEAAAAQRRAAAEAAAAEAASQAAAQKAAEEAAAQAAAQKAAEEEAARKAAAEAAAQAAAQNADTASATDATQVEYTETTDTTSTTDTTATTTTDTTSYTTTTTTTTTTTDTSTAMATYSGGGFTWPMPSSYTITSPFGYRDIDVEGATSNHRGVDISCPTGSSVVAAADGVVSYVGYLGTAGNAVLIDHGNGITTMYYHLSAFNTSVGANVYAGQTIAYSGSTGASSGPHLHFGVRINGAYVDPMGYF